jgi:hypothetical protein
MGGLETIVSLQSILLAFGFSVGIGIFFGLYPATKASNHKTKKMRGIELRNSFFAKNRNSVKIPLQVNKFFSRRMKLHCR